MILKKLVINNFGPFAVPVTLELESRVTVLTGQNDTGKSSVLRLLQLLYTGGVVQEDDVNTNRIFDASQPWRKDAGIACVATFVLASDFAKYANLSGLTSGSGIDITYSLAPDLGRRWNITSIHSKNGASSAVSGYYAERMPQLVVLPLEPGISSTLNTQSLNPLETQFLEFAFGRNVAKLNSLTPAPLKQALRMGTQQLNTRLKNVLPASMNLNAWCELS